MTAWLFEPGDARRLAAIRIGLSLLLAERLTRPLYVGLAAMPDPLYRPLSFMKLLDGMPPRALVLVLQIVGCAAAVLAALGWRARVTLPLAWACGTFLGGMTTSVGKVVHNDVLLLLCLVPLLAARTSDAWALDARGRPAPDPSWRYGWPVRTATVVIAGAYFFAGLQKLINSGPAWVLSDNMRWVMYAASDARAEPITAALFIADRPRLAQLVAASILLLELTFPLVLFRLRLAPLFVAGAICFSAGIRVTVGLDYSVWAATVLVVLVDWPTVWDRLRARRAGTVPAC